MAFSELMCSGVDGIIVTAGNPKRLKPLIDRAESKGMRWCAWTPTLGRVNDRALFTLNPS